MFVFAIRHVPCSCLPYDLIYFTYEGVVYQKAGAVADDCFPAWLHQKNVRIIDEKTMVKKVMSESIDDASIIGLVKVALCTIARQWPPNVTLEGTASSVTGKDLATKYKYTQDVLGVKSVVNNMTVDTRPRTSKKTWKRRIQ